MKAVQNPHRHRRQTDEEDVGEHDPVQEGGQFQFARSFGKPVCHGSNEQGRKQDSQNGQHGHYQSDKGDQGIGELPCILAVIAGNVLGKYGDECGAHSAFADEATKEIWDHVSDGVGVGGDACAEKKCDALVAHVTENAAEESDCGDEGGRPEQRTVFAHSFQGAILT